MRRLRPRLTALIVLMLLQQAAVGAATIALACCQEGAKPAPMQCCARGGGDGHICPLMGRSGDAAGRCGMKSTCSSDRDATPLMAFAFAAPIPPAVRIESPPARAGAARGRTPDLCAADLAREGPPPKA